MHNKNVEGFELPFNLMPNSSILLKAELDFNNVEVFKREAGKEGFYYHIRIKHSKGLYKKKI